MLIYIIMSSYSTRPGELLGVTDHQKNAEAIRDSYCTIHGVDPSKIQIFTYSFKGEDTQ